MIGNFQKSREGKIGLLISEPNFQRGHGLFSMLTKRFKMLTPLLKKGVSVVKKVATSAPVKRIGKDLSNSALNIAGEALTDDVESKNPAENFSSNLQKARKNISKTLKQELKRKLGENSESIYPKTTPKKKKKYNKNRNKSIL